MDIAQLKSHLKIEPDFVDEDTDLGRFLAAAKEDADRALINPFTTTGRLGGTVIPIPALVEDWVVKRAAQIYEWRILGQRKETIMGLGSAERDLETDYTDILHLRDPAGLVGW